MSCVIIWLYIWYLLASLTSLFLLYHVRLVYYSLIGTDCQEFLDGINFFVDANGAGVVHHMLMQKDAWNHSNSNEKCGHYWIVVLEVISLIGRRYPISASYFCLIG